MSKKILAGATAGLLLGVALAKAKETAVPEHMKEMLKDFSIYYVDNYEDPPVEWGPRIVNLDAWYTKLISYVSYSAHHGQEDIIVVGIEDLTTVERAEDYADTILRVQMEPRLTSMLFKGSIDKIIYYKENEIYRYVGRSYAYENRDYDSPYIVRIDVPD